MKIIKKCFAAGVVALLVGLQVPTGVLAQVGTGTAIVKSTGPILDAYTVYGVIRTGGASLSDSPMGPSLGSLASGSLVALRGVDASGGWFYGESADLAGWVERNRVIGAGLDLLPQMDAEGVPVSLSARADREAATVEPLSDLAVTSAPLELGVGEAVTGTVRTTGGSRLNIRTGPGLVYPVAARAEHGQPLIVLAQSLDGDWLQISDQQLPDGVGWVAAAYVQRSDAPALPVQTAPATAVRATRPASVAPVSTAPLGGRLVFQLSSGGPIYTMAANGRGLTYLTYGIDPALSHDGQRVAFTRFGGEAGLYVIDVDGQNLRKLLGYNEIRSPSWSLDDSHIAFTIQNAESDGRTFTRPDGSTVTFGQKDYWRLEMVDANGENREGIPDHYRSLTPEWGALGILFAPSGNKLISGDLFRTAPDGEPVQLYSGYNRIQDPVASPDGLSVLATMMLHDHWEIVRMNGDGGGLVRLTPSSTKAQSVSPTWSPDGRRIVFLSDRDGSWRLWVMNADGSNPVLLAPQTLSELTFDYRFVLEQMVDWK